MSLIKQLRKLKASELEKEAYSTEDVIAENETTASRALRIELKKKKEGLSTKPKQLPIRKQSSRK